MEKVCRAFETIKQQGKVGQDARRKGHELALQRGWLSADELTNLYESCKPARHGLPAEPMAKGTQLSLDQARLLVRRMLVRWAEDLAHDPRAVRRALSQPVADAEDDGLPSEEIAAELIVMAKAARFAWTNR